ncbi:hypothetical protein TRIP_E350022 [uncultured Spirochaetota bacterium]|nr:hypothetical protein TRIP_E350022 [uncultured Spirochaetota bacterium]
MAHTFQIYRISKLLILLVQIIKTIKL